MSKPGLPIRDPTEPEIEAYLVDGVICLRNIIPRNWIEEMQTAIDETVQSPPPIVKTFIRQKNGYSGGIHLWKLQQPFHNLLYRSPVSCIAMRAMQARK